MIAPVMLSKARYDYIHYHPLAPDFKQQMTQTICQLMGYSADMKSIDMRKRIFKRFIMQWAQLFCVTSFLNVKIFSAVYIVGAAVQVCLDFLMNLTINLDKLTRCLKSRMSRNSRKCSSQVSTPWCVVFKWCVLSYQQSQNIKICSI